MPVTSILTEISSCAISLHFEFFGSWSSSTVRDLVNSQDYICVSRASVTMNLLNHNSRYCTKMVPEYFVYLSGIVFLSSFWIWQFLHLRHEKERSELWCIYSKLFINIYVCLLRIINSWHVNHGIHDPLWCQVSTRSLLTFRLVWVCKRGSPRFPITHLLQHPISNFRIR